MAKKLGINLGKTCPACGLSLIFLQELRGDTEGYCWGCYIKWLTGRLFRNKKNKKGR